MQPVSNTHPAANTRTFTLDLRGTTVQIEATISRAAYEIFSVRDANGQVSTTAGDLDEIEAQLDRIQETSLTAFDPETRAVERFTVVSLGWNILWIVREDGSTVRRSSPAFTEVAESWHIDREYAAAVESDAPHAAAVAGYLHPVPSLHRAGHGLRRAA